MAAKFYLYQTNGKYYMGSITDSTRGKLVLPGNYEIEDHNEIVPGKITISKVSTGQVVYSGLVSETCLANQTCPFTTYDQLISSVGDLFAGAVAGGASFYSFPVEITRPANVTAYTAGDIIGDVTDGVLKTIANVAKATGKGVRIYRVRIQTDDTGVLSGTVLQVHIYRDTPDVTGLVDNGAFAMNYANAKKRVGRIPIVMNGLVGDCDFKLIGLNPADRNIYCILENVTGHTPSANSTHFTIIFDCELSNN